MKKRMVVELVNGARVSKRDQKKLATKPIAGSLLAMLSEEQDGTDDTVLSRFLTREEAPEDLDAAILKLARKIEPDAVDVMRVTKKCRLFFVRGSAAAMLDLARLRKHLGSGLRGDAIIGVPAEDLLCAFFIDDGDFVTGVTNVAVNVHAHFDATSPEALSPHIYWVSKGEIMELPFQLDDENQIEKLKLPETLAARWND